MPKITETPINHKYLGAINFYDNIKPKKGDSEFTRKLKKSERERIKGELKEVTDEDWWM